MHLLFSILLGIHIFAGSIALITGAVAIAARKGKKVHNLNGRIYHLTMIAVGITALVMAFWKSNPFLLGTAVFTLYMVYTGKRMVKRKRNEARWKVRLDDVVLGGGFLGGGFLLAEGIPSLLVHGLGMNIVAIVFGAVTLVFAGRDLSIRLKGKQYNYKDNLLLHIGRMGGSYIATFTAFLVTNVRIEPGWILWLAPSAAGSILIAMAIGKWRKRLSPVTKKSTDQAQTISGVSS